MLQIPCCGLLLFLYDAAAQIVYFRPLQKQHAGVLALVVRLQEAALEIVVLPIRPAATIATTCGVASGERKRT